MYNLESLKVLYEFDVIVKVILSDGNNFDYLKQTLKSKGIPVIGKGGFKTVFKYKICCLYGKRKTGAEREIYSQFTIFN